MGQLIPLGTLSSWSSVSPGWRPLPRWCWSKVSTSPSGRMIGMSDAKIAQVWRHVRVGEARTEFRRNPVHELELFRVDDEGVGERREAQLPVTRVHRQPYIKCRLFCAYLVAAMSRRHRGHLYSRSSVPKTISTHCVSGTSSYVTRPSASRPVSCAGTGTLSTSCGSTR